MVQIICAMQDDTFVGRNKRVEEELGHARSAGLLVLLPDWPSSLRLDSRKVQDEPGDRE